jgi:LmbE family N-acetylglucosaminyl deacetylase
MRGLAAGFHRSTRGTARLLLYPAIETVWRWIFAGAGYVLRPTTRTLVPTGLDRVLVLAPHPDDETIGCGGAMALHALAGDNVTVCIITDGGQSRAGGLLRTEMKVRRRREAQNAIAALGSTELIQLDLPEGEWGDQELVKQLVSIFERAHPTVIYTTSIVDYHPEHMRAAQCLRVALSRLESRAGITIRLYEVQVPLTPLLANLVADIGRVERQKSQALEAYVTQRNSLGWVRRYSSYQQRLYRAPGLVEVFCEVPAERFVSLHRHTGGQPGNFRGIHSRPFTDIAAWLVGTRSRLRLRKQIEGSGD